MKANEAPKKIYLTSDEKNSYVFTQKRSDGIGIEYIRTDAFIEEAVKWIEEIYNHHYIMRYSDSCEPPLIELTEWFRNYMEGE